MPKVGGLSTGNPFTGGDLTTAINWPEAPLTTTDLITMRVTGQSYDRFQINAAGRLYWGGGGSAPAQGIYRRNSDTLHANTGIEVSILGVGNSAAGNTLGNLVKQFELFDDAGNSLGYVPIYDAITQV